VDSESKSGDKMGSFENWGDGPPPPVLPSLLSGMLMLLLVRTHVHRSLICRSYKHDSELMWSTQHLNDALRPQAGELLLLI